MFQQQQQQQTQKNVQYHEQQSQQNQRNYTQNTMKSRDTKEIGKNFIIESFNQDEQNVDNQFNSPYHITNSEEQNNQRKRSKTSFLQNGDFQTSKSTTFNKQTSDYMNQKSNGELGHKIKDYNSIDLCQNNMVPFSNEIFFEEQNSSNKYVDQDEFKKYRNYVGNKTKGSKSQILQRITQYQDSQQENYKTNYKEKAPLQIIHPHQAIQNMMPMGNKQNNVQSIQTARSVTNTLEHTNTNRSMNTININEDYNSINRAISQRNHIKYSSMHFQDGNFGIQQNNNDQNQYLSNRFFDDRMQTLPEQSLKQENESIQSNYQHIEQIYKQNPQRQVDSKMQRKSCILDSNRSEQIQSQTYRQESNNSNINQDTSCLLSHRQFVYKQDSQNRGNNNTPNQIHNQENDHYNSNIIIQKNSHLQTNNKLQLTNNQQKQSIIVVESPQYNGFQQNSQIKPKQSNNQYHQNIKSTPEQKQACKGNYDNNLKQQYKPNLNIQNPQNSSQKIQNLMVQNSPQLVQYSPKLVQNSPQLIQNSPQMLQYQSQKVQNRLSPHSNINQQLFEQNEQNKQKINVCKEQIISLQTHNRQLLNQIKILESDNSNQIQTVKQLQEQIIILEQNLQSSDKNKNMAIIQHQKVLEQVQKLEQEVKLIKEQSTKFSLDRYQNQGEQQSPKIQQFQNDFHNLTSQNDYSFDETHSPFSMNNIASAKSAETTQTLFSQKSSTCIIKPQSNLQQQNIQQNQQQSSQQNHNQQLQIQQNQNQSKLNYQQNLLQQSKKQYNSTQDGLMLFEQTFSQDDQNHAQESKKSQMIKMDAFQKQLSSYGFRNENAANTASFDILYQIYQKLGEGCADQLDQIPEKIDSLIQENKLNGKFIKSMRELMMNCAPSNYFESSEPSLKVIWKFILKVIEEYAYLKSKSTQLAEKCIKETNSQTVPNKSVNNINEPINKYNNNQKTELKIQEKQSNEQINSNNNINVKTTSNS